MKRRIIFSLIAGLIMALAVSIHAADYPTKPIILMVAYAAGGETDIGARILAAIAEKELGQPIVVVNKGGAGGQVGWTDLAKQKPDGYTIGFVNPPALNSIILDPERKATFSLDHFVPIINQVVDPVCFYVKPESPYETFKDLLEDAKKRPGKITVTTTGIFSNEHLGILMLQDAAKIKFRIVHFDGSAQINTALIGGQIDVGVDNVGGAWASRVKAGQVRPLLVMDRERTKFYPNVPTTIEQGYPTVLMSSSRGIVGPKGIPEPIIKKLQAVFQKAMEDPQHMEKMDKAALAVKIMVGEKYGKYIKDLHETTKKLIEIARKAD
ncbi:MAG: tripartite tricarboxylate transporter substrate binding protein [Thermodesulfobacteriota bacterium]|nr:tripartite tricarboxylate transporter substrate binding protein [Thermodesulfobacteriota bacterium]